MKTTLRVTRPQQFPSLLLWAFLICIFSVGFLSAVGLVQSNRVIVWSEDWERDWTINWHVESGTWEVGVPTSGPGKPHQGQKCAATVLAGNYSEPVNTRLIRHTPFVVPSKNQNPRLRFWHWYSFAAGDYGEVQISTNGGRTWKQSNSPVYYEHTSSGAWTYASFDLSVYADSTIQIAFYFHSQQVNCCRSDVSSGWYIDEIELITGPLIFNNPEKFESGIGDWVVERGTWEVGRPTVCYDFAYSPPNCAGTVLGGGYYSEPVDSRLISPPFIVPRAVKNPALRFWHWYDFAAGDYGEVQIKIGKGAWKAISNRFINNSSNVWTSFSTDLSAYADSTVQIAFYFHSQQVNCCRSDVNYGWYIDDVEVVPPSVTPASIGFRNVKMSQTATQSVTVTNTGTGTVNVGSISVQGNDAANFSVNQTAFTLGSGQSQKVEVRFTPDGVRIFNASLQINSDAANVSARLTGHVVDNIPIKVYVMSGGNTMSDQAVLSVLTARGFSPILGVPIDKWDGTQANLKNFNAVVLLNNYNWRADSMAQTGQNALKNYVEMGNNGKGGGLVTGEWLIASIYSGKKNKGLDPMLPATYGGHKTLSSTSYTRDGADIILNYGLPITFSFPLNFIDGAEGILDPKPGATVFYNSCNTGHSGLIGWNYNNKGRVISFSTLISHIELADPEYAMVFVNAVKWAAERTTAVDSDDGILLPSVYQLDQNYPNPFNPSTTIRFSLPRSGHVTLKVFNLLGAEATTLMDQELTAGRYEAHWDASGVESGVYFYQLRAGEFVATRKLVLVQ